MQRIIDEFRGKTLSLPLLQTFLFALWERGRGPTISHRDYEEIGGVQQYVGSYVDRVLEGLTPNTREVATRVFLRLTSPETSSRVLVRYSEFSAEEKDAIEQLTRAGVLTRTEDECGFVALTHDSLVKSSKILNSRWAEMSEFLSWKNTFATHVSEWVALGHSTDALLRGVRLREAVNFLDSRHRTYFSESEHRYIRSSLRQRRLRAMILLTCVIITLVFLLIVLRTLLTR